MAKLIRPDMTEEEVPLNAQGRVDWDLARKLLGCQYLEPFRFSSEQALLMDEEAKLRTPPQGLNLKATQLLMGRIALDDEVVGNVILCTHYEAGYGGDEEEE